MPTFVALLRGVNNIGTARRVPMAELRALLSGLGYTGVTTLLNSGNAVFRASGGTPAKHSASIAAAILTQLKLEVPVIVKSASELAAILSDSPINAGADAHSRFLVAFTRDIKALSSLAAIEPLVVPSEQFAVGRSAAYLLCSPRISESKAGRALLGKSGKSATTRNWATVLKLHALAMKATPNPSIERTSSSRLRLLPAATHVKR
jgi:uncharacterized protein (DUF1697 family)